MAKVLRVVAIVAGAVAIFATAGAALVGTGAFLGMTATTLTTIATWASVAGGLASIGGMLLTKPPPARGSVSQVVIQAEPPTPYVMGEGYCGGVLRYDRAYGYEGDTPNPFRWQVFVHSHGGPIHSIAPRLDFDVISSWYTGYLHLYTQLGACPESSALMPGAWPGAPDWSSSSKLSGQAALGWNMHFDKKGKRFGSGVPLQGAYGKWVLAYDPRKDSTRPGGSGSHRIGVESTYEWTECPALHAGTYTYGRWQNGKKVMGIGQPDEGIDWAAIAAWANDCDANGWTIFGRVFEPGDRWANLKDMAMAGGGRPVFSGGLISFDWARPRVALAVITEKDLGEGRFSKLAARGYTDRYNTLVPKYTDPGSNWEQVSAEAVKVAAYVTADGEERRQEWPLNLVKDVDQAAQLTRYAIEDSREQEPITIPLQPQWRAIMPGEAYELDIPQLGYNGQLAVLQSKSVNPQTFEVTATFRTENDAKHAAALAQVGVPPPAVGAVQTPQERDETRANAMVPSEVITQLISTSYVTDSDPSDGLIQATGTTITVETHARTYTDRTVTVTGGSITTEDDGTTALTATTTYHVYYDDGGRLGGAISLKATKIPAIAATSGDNPTRHYVGSITTDVATGGTGTSAGGALPPSWKYEDFYL